MNEISVVVLQTPGEVSWNYLEIKNRLKEELEAYKKTAYTDDTIKTAKSDIADLRKLAKAIEDRRKEVKEKCLEPYTPIENQAKELVELIEEPIQAINNQVKDYEKRRKEKARAEINAYWTQKAAELPEDIREKAKKAIYDERWENATATKKSWREGIENGIRKILDEIGTIKSFASEFEEDMLTVYKDALSLQKAIQKMNELNAQKERILEQERKRREAEEAEKKRQEEERQRREELAKQKAQEEQQRPEAPKNPGGQSFPRGGIPTRTIPQPQTEAKMGYTETPVNSGLSGGFVPHPDKSANMAHNQEPETKAYPNGKMQTVRILGTEEQITKILNYIRFTGATYEEV